MGALKRRTLITLGLSALAVLSVAALPAGVFAHEPADTCPNPALFGQSDADAGSSMEQAGQAGIEDQGVRGDPR